MFHSAIRLVLAYLQCLFRSCIKWFLRRTTGLSELQRICYGDREGAERTINMEESLRKSKHPQIQEIVVELDKLHMHTTPYSSPAAFLGLALSNVHSCKQIKPRIHPHFAPSFSKCIKSLQAYECLKFKLEKHRKCPYDSKSKEHETLLLNLWSMLMPDVALSSRITKQWQQIGFQGDDPQTDFRGMGMLGLVNLHYFAQEHRIASLHVLSHSQHPAMGYSYAIVGINLTSMAYELVMDGAAKTTMFNTTHKVPDLRMFNEFYSYLFYEFDRFWRDEKPKDIMEFPKIRKRFEANIRQALSNHSTVFRLNVAVQIV